MYCAIYIRKSREEKDKTSHRLNVQREQLPAYAKSQGWHYEIYDDGHASAARGKTENLPERARLERDIRAGKIQVILVIELSRLSRDDTMQDFMAWLSLCRDNGVRLATPSQTIDPSQTDHWVLSGITGILSAAEMQWLEKRMKEGREEAFRTGKFLGGTPPPPYVYDAAAGRPVIDPAALEKIRILWEMAETKSAKAIAEELNMPEIAVRRAISNDRLDFYQAKRIDPKTLDVIRCDWEPCMAAEQALRIRAARRTRRSLKGGPKAKYAGLLTNLGMLFCGYCGKRVKTWHGKVRKSDGVKVTYYACTAKNGTSCPKSRMIQQHDLNSAVTDNLVHTLERLDELQQYWLCSLDQSDPAKRLTELDQEEKKESGKKSRLVAAISEGVMDFADAKDQMTRINDSLARIQAEKQNIRAQQATPPDWESLALDYDDWGYMAPDDQREIISLAIDRVDIFFSYAIISYKFPRTKTGEMTSRVHLPAPIK